MNPEKIPQEKNIISELFPDPETFTQKVEEALEWRDQGGPEVGTSSFAKAVCNEAAANQLSSEEFGKLQKAIRQKVAEIRKEQDQETEKSEQTSETSSNEEGDDNKETNRMIEEAKRLERNELKRSGDVDPNEI